MGSALLMAAGNSAHGLHRAAESSAGMGQYVILGIFIVAVAWVFFLAVRMTVKPGEREENHIKRTALKDD